MPFKIGDVVAYKLNYQMMRIIDVKQNEDSNKIIYELMDNKGQTGYFMFESSLICVSDAYYELQLFVKNDDETINQET